ncbi:hypothetical protein YC2023_058526 [Brassica napus]
MELTTRKKKFRAVLILLSRQLHPEMDPNETDVSAFSHDWQTEIESQLRDLGNTSSSLLHLLSLGGTKTTKICDILVLLKSLKFIVI